jgi:hypothetical protein
MRGLYVSPVSTALGDRRTVLVVYCVAHVLLQVRRLRWSRRLTGLCTVVGRRPTRDVFALTFRACLAAKIRRRRRRVCQYLQINLKVRLLS